MSRATTDYLEQAGQGSQQGPYTRAASKVSKADVSNKPHFTVTGAGVLHVRSSEILKSKKARRQIAALSRMREKSLER